MTPEPDTAPARLDALTGVRALAAGWVVLFHLGPEFEERVGGLDGLGRVTDVGFVGVDLFFVLSGFILSLTYADRTLGPGLLRRHARFVWLRLARVYPVHLAVLVALGAVALAAQAAGGGLAQQGDARSWVVQALMLNGWGGSATLTWNGPSWSISAEWFAYLLFPAFVVVAALGTTRARALGGAALSLGAGLGILALLGLDQRTLVLEAPLLRVSAEFLCGCFLFRAHQLLPRDWAGWGPVAAAALALSVAGAVALGDEAVLVAPALACAVLALASGRGAVAVALARPGMVRAGQLSYAAYVVHVPLLLVLTRVLPAPGSAVVGLAQSLVLTAAIPLAALLAFHLVEQPGREALRRVVLRPAAAAHPADGTLEPARAGHAGTAAPTAAS